MFHLIEGAWMTTPHAVENLLKTFASPNILTTNSLVLNGSFIDDINT